jgi:hypothetical protein
VEQPVWQLMGEHELASFVYTGITDPKPYLSKNHQNPDGCDVLRGEG